MYRNAHACNAPEKALTLFVDDGQSPDALPSPFPNWDGQGSSLQDLTRELNAERVLIADSGFQLDANMWALLTRSEFDSGVVVQCSRRLAFERQLMEWMLAVFHWFFLGTCATPLNRACLCIPVSRIGQLTEGCSGKVAVSQLVGVLRANREPVWESKVTVVGPEILLSWSQFGAAVMTTVKFWWQSIKFPATGSEVVREPGGVTPFREFIGWMGLMAAAILVFSLNLGYPLFEPDEARNAQLAMNILQTGEWMSLQLGGEPYWDKPPLVAWLVASVYQVLGVDEWGTRLPGNLAGLVTVALVFGLGRKLVSWSAAWCGALMLCLSIGFVACSRYVTLDSVLTMFTTLAFFSGYLASSADRFRWNWWLVFCAAAGLGVLTKGPVILVLTLPVLLVLQYLTPSNCQIPWRRWGWLVLLVVLIAGPWYLAMCWVHPDFPLYFFWRHHVVRFTEAFNHREPWWYYVPVVLLALYPAIYAFPFLVRWMSDNQPAIRRSRTRAIGFLSLAAGWVLFLFSLSEAKLPTYILPALPVLCLLMGVALHRRLTDVPGATQGWLVWGPRIAGLGLVALVLIGLLASFERPLPGTNGGWLVCLPFGLLVFAAIGSIYRRTEPAWRRWASAAVLSVLAISGIFAGAIPRIAEARSVSRAVGSVQSQAGYSQLPVVFWEHDDFATQLWFRDANTYTFDENEGFEAFDFLSRQPAVVLVAKADLIARLKKSMHGMREILPVPGARHVYLFRQQIPSLSAHRAPIETVMRFDEESP